MTLSYNGWTASPDASLIGIERFKIGQDTYVYLRDTAAPVLVWMANYWDAHIEDIDAGQQDDWGWAYRETRGGGSISNHASGTALDINALRYPRGTNNMTAVKQRQVMDMCGLVNTAAGKTLVLWGGLWSGEYKDQMHLELASGTDADDVARAVRNLDTPTDWFDMATKADLRDVVDNALDAKLTADNPAFLNAVRVAIEAERAEDAAAVWDHQLVNAVSGESQKAGTFLRYMPKRFAEILAAVKTP